MRGVQTIELERLVVIGVGLFCENQRCGWVHALQESVRLSTREKAMGSTCDNLYETESREVRDGLGEAAVRGRRVLVDYRAIRRDPYDTKCDAFGEHKECLARRVRKQMQQ